ncbi:uracil-DNA glycosylase [Cyanobacteria bacterium FACHB-472]|nr:uracil-DNA glycosylase [Cyanobacteria bacterium FACHB-472]
MQYLFSEFRASEFDQLYQEISQVFNISKEQLNALYLIMREELEKEGYPAHTLNRNIFLPSDESFRKRYDNAFVIGVDIPSILELDNGVKDKKTVAILGQDPLRRSETRVEEISIGTPYALHLKNCREKLRNTRLYFDLIKVLLESGYRVYLTDVFKVWVSSSNGKSGIPLSQKDCNRFINLLKDELEIFEPLAVITWGRIASKTVSGINLKIKHLKFPHPSGAANGTWRKIMGKSPTRENRINYWKQTIFDYLDSLISKKE